MSSYTKPKRISLKSDPNFSESWVEEIIAKDPSVLGLGDLAVHRRQLRQPGAGQLDLLLVDEEGGGKRYEVELQLGASDPSHIIRCIEYWDFERRSHPGFDHCAVLVAEDITGRFFNVVSLFNGVLPIIALQMQALKVGDHVTLVFTKVLDETQRSSADEDSDAISTPADRPFWEDKASRETIEVMDKIFGWVRETDPDCELKYNKPYVGLAKNGRSRNYVTFRPQKRSLVFGARLPQSEESDTKLDAAGLETLGYAGRGTGYRIRVTKPDLEENEDLFRDLIKEARNLWDT